MILSHHFNIIKYFSSPNFSSAKVNPYIYFFVTDKGSWWWYITETVSKVCKKFLQKNCCFLYKLDEWLRRTWLSGINKADLSWVQENTFWFCLHLQRGRLSRGHWDNRTVIRVIHVAILWHTHFPLFRFSWSGVTGGLVWSRTVFLWSLNEREHSVRDVRRRL
jgi:hypothetical protein